MDLFYNKYFTRARNIELAGTSRVYKNPGSTQSRCRRALSLIPTYSSLNFYTSNSRYKLFQYLESFIFIASPPARRTNTYIYIRT